MYGLGVTKESKRKGKQFRARLNYHGVVDLGRFSTAHEACLAYDQAVRAASCEKPTNYPAGLYAHSDPQVQQKVQRHLKVLRSLGSIEERNTPAGAAPVSLPAAGPSTHISHGDQAAAAPSRSSRSASAELPADTMQVESAYPDSAAAGEQQQAGVLWAPSGGMGAHMLLQSKHSVPVPALGPNQSWTISSAPAADLLEPWSHDAAAGLLAVSSPIGATHAQLSDMLQLQDTGPSNNAGPSDRADLAALLASIRAEDSSPKMQKQRVNQKQAQPVPPSNGNLPLRQGSGPAGAAAALQQQQLLHAQQSVLSSRACSPSTAFNHSAQRAAGTWPVAAHMHKHTVQHAQANALQQSVQQDAPALELGHLQAHALGHLQAHAQGRVLQHLQDRGHAYGEPHEHAQQHTQQQAQRLVLQHAQVAQQRAQLLAGVSTGSSAAEAAARVGGSAHNVYPAAGWARPNACAEDMCAYGSHYAAPMLAEQHVATGDMPLVDGAGWASSVNDAQQQQAAVFRQQQQLLTALPCLTAAEMVAYADLCAAHLMQLHQCMGQHLQQDAALIAVGWINEVRLSMTGPPVGNTGAAGCTGSGSGDSSSVQAAVLRTCMALVSLSTGAAGALPEGQQAGTLIDSSMFVPVVEHLLQRLLSLKALCAKDATNPECSHSALDVFRQQLHAGGNSSVGKAVAVILGWL